MSDEEGEGEQEHRIPYLASRPSEEALCALDLVVRVVATEPIDRHQRGAADCSHNGE
jgi:hypothetical protein